MDKLTASPQDVYLVDGLRTPFLKLKAKRGSFSASDLAVCAGRELLSRFAFSPSDLSEVIMGCVMPSPEEANIARIIALRLGCGKTVPAWTVQRNCASGLQAIDSAVRNIAACESTLILAGGCEAMSHAPLLYNENMTNWLLGLRAAKGYKEKFKRLSQFRPTFLSPVIALMQGLTDPIVNLSMGQTAENLAYRFNISRQAMDEFALESHRRAATAQDQHFFEEINSIFDQQGQNYSSDEGVRRDTTLEKLTTLRAFFDKRFGNVTAGNSSQISDGAALVLLASQEAVRKFKLPVLAKISAAKWAGVAPEEMGLGPVNASIALLAAQKLSLNQIDFWEINEAFAAQVLACLKAFADPDYCKAQGLNEALGQIDKARLNVDGGAIALGHPVGASGARLVLHLAHVLKKHNAKRGIATLCIGGGQGGAILIENVSEVSA